MDKKLPDEMFELGYSEGVKEPLVRRKTGQRRPVERMKPIRRNIDYSPAMYQELEDVSIELGVPAQNIVKMALQEWLMRYEAHKTNLHQQED